MPFEMNDYMKKFAEKATSMISEGQKLSEAETVALGKKEVDEEVSSTHAFAQNYSVCR